jgi:hypothetical protein
MSRMTKAQREADLLRERIIVLLAEPYDWLDYEHIYNWLQKLLKRDRKDGYTPAERAAVARIIVARTPFEEWGGYSVPELIAAALMYMADFSYEDELFLKDIEARRPTRLALVDMKHLVGLCRYAGIEIPRFAPEIDSFDEAA